MPPCPVLYISTSAALGGAELSLLQFLRHIDRDRFPPSVALPRGEDGPLQEELEKEGILPHHVPMAPLTRKGRGLRLVSSLVRLRRAGYAITATARYPLRKEPVSRAQVRVAETLARGESAALSPRTRRRKSRYTSSNGPRQKKTTAAVTRTQGIVRSAGAAAPAPGRQASPAASRAPGRKIASPQAA